ncbi:MAG TPA: MMPL family transporter [Thermomicrobiales bacterium]|nr:MMPL family transporter [Thermomicrobiales bacterium]
MFTRWGFLLAARARLVLVLAVLTLVGAVGALATVAPNLSSEGFVSDDAESAVVDRNIAATFGEDGDAIVFLFSGPAPVDDPATRQAVEATLGTLADDPRVSTTLTTWSTGNPAMISTDRLSTYAVALLDPAALVDPTDAETFAHDIAHDIEAAGTTRGLSVTAGGGVLVGAVIPEEVERGLIRAETFSVPASLLIQILVFGSLVAAGIPLLIAALAIAASIALIFVFSTDMFQSVFAINVITMLGLGLGIDYSLFMITRFREELARRPVAEAVAVTMATVGKAILVSGLTVILGLAATQFFPLPSLQSMGQAGIAVTAMALVYGLTLLPAILALLGHRVNAVRIGRRRPATAVASQTGGFWHGIATSVMRRPVVVMASVLALLLVMATPLLRLDLTPGGPEVLPDGSGPRVVAERLTTDFPANDAEPIPVLVTVADGNATSPASVAALRDLEQRLTAIAGVTGVNSFVAPGLATAAGYDWSTYGGDPSLLPETITGTIGTTVRGDQVVLEVMGAGSSAELEQVVRDVRATAVTGLSIGVGGFYAASVDTIDGIRSGLVPAAVFVLVAAYLILLLTFGSILLPIKAILMSLLSISAALGTTVWVFQDGRLEGLLGFTASGEIVSTTPILVFCILFGLSMDYEVLLLSRIQEEYRRTGDNRAAVAAGLAGSGRTITGAAAIMIVVFGGFMLADIVILKSMGFALALAVLIDATVVRGLLVPATMRLLGRWNWWAPAPLGRLVDRLGLGHESAPAAPPLSMPAD